MNGGVVVPSSMLSFWAMFVWFLFLPERASLGLPEPIFFYDGCVCVQGKRGENQTIFFIRDILKGKSWEGCVE